MSKARGLSSRSLRDAVLAEHIAAVHSANYGVYGVRKMWHALRREGINIGREQTARLMRIAASTGTVVDSYDNALAENINGSYKNELINTRRWVDVVEVEIATIGWVSWWNEGRLHQSLGYRTPGEVESEFWEQNPPQEIIEIKANA